jgi:predicted fused transcriptional regulator/phosphomethylpyrimidine kinase
LHAGVDKKSIWDLWVVFFVGGTTEDNSSHSATNCKLIVAPRPNLICRANLFYKEGISKKFKNAFFSSSIFKQKTEMKKLQTRSQIENRKKISSSSFSILRTKIKNFKLVLAT